MKSFVTMETKICIVCGTEHESGSILLDTRMRDRFDHHTPTGWGMCDTCEAQRNSGFVAMVEANNSDPSKGTLAPSDAARTGRIVWLKREAFEQVFNVPVPDKGVCFIEPGVIEQLQSLQAEEVA
jgi:hypothetical protein